MKKLALALSILALLCGCGNRPPSSLIVVTVNPETPPSIDQGQTFNFTASLVTNNPSVTLGGVVWTATGPGCVGATCGSFSNVGPTSVTYVAPATVSAPLSVTVTATSVNQPLQTSTATFFVTPPPSITTTDLPSATPTYIYHTAIIATGGVQPLNWSIASGTLPAGLSLNPDGVLFGTPTTGSTTTLTVEATDSSGSPIGKLSVQHTFTFTVVGLLTLPGGALPDGKVGTAYSTQLTANGGVAPYSWSLYNGSLPSGLILQKSGVISGTPTLVESASFQFQVVDSSPIQQTFTSTAYTLTIDPAGPLSIRTTGLMNGTVNLPYNAQLVATGGTPPITWVASTGALPAGLDLNAATGAITGTITGLPGVYPFTVQATDSSSPPVSVTQNLSITVDTGITACASTGNNSVLVGQYAFSLSGYNAAGYLSVIGSFTADGAGNVTGGEADTNGVLGPQTGNLMTSASSYSVGPDNRGCATLATPFGTFYARFAVGSLSNGVATAGRMIEFETPSANAFIASGPLFQQNPNAFITGISGGYDIAVSGSDPTAPGRYACLGQITGIKNKFSFIEEDCNDNGSVTNNINTSTNENTQVNTYSAADTNGRGTGNFAVGQGTSSFTFYWVSLTELFVVNSDPDLYYSGTWNQEIVPQGSRGFQQSQFDGSLDYYANGLASSQAAGTVLLTTANSDGASLLTSQNYLDTAGAAAISTATCTYTVLLNGRVTLAGSSCGATPPLFYLNSVNTGAALGTDATVQFGAFQPGTPNLTTSAMAGTYYAGTTEIVNQQAQAEVRIITLGANGVLTTTTDVATTLTQSAGVANSDTLVLKPDESFSTGSSAGTVVGIAISPTMFVIEGNPTLTFPTLQIAQR